MLAGNFIFWIKNTGFFLRKWKWLSTGSKMSMTTWKLLFYIIIMCFESLWNSLAHCICKETWKPYLEYICIYLLPLSHGENMPVNFKFKPKKQQKIRVEFLQGIRNWWEQSQANLMMIQWWKLKATRSCYVKKSVVLRVTFYI